MEQQDTQTLHKNRPLSPHLSIYKLQLTSALSILHRITGAYLYVGLVVLAWAIFTLVYFPYILEDISDCIYNYAITRIIFKFMVLSWTFSLFYHQLNGIRHLFWDVGKGFDLKTTYITGRIVVILAILLTIACWALVCMYQTPVEMIIIEDNIIADSQ